MIRGALFDVSGVLYVGAQPIPGAAEAIEKLKRSGVPVRFITNVTRTPTRRLLQRLSRMGFRVGQDELFSAPIAAREHIKAHGLDPYLLVHSDLENEFADLTHGSPNAVLLGDAGEGFTYQRLNRAFRLLMEGAPLLAMGNNRYFKEADGLSLDIGPFASALEYASGTKAIILGKPSAEFFGAALASVGCSATGSVMVGDDVMADVMGALRAGIRGILVQTGKYQAGDEDRIQGKEAVMVPDVVAAVDWILEQA